MRRAALITSLRNVGYGASNVTIIRLRHGGRRFAVTGRAPLLASISSFQSDSLDAIEGVRQNLQESFRLTCHSRFPHDLARINHAEGRPLPRREQWAGKDDRGELDTETRN